METKIQELDTQKETSKMYTSTDNWETAETRHKCLCARGIHLYYNLLQQGGVLPIGKVTWNYSQPKTYMREYTKQVKQNVVMHGLEQQTCIYFGPADIKTSRTNNWDYVWHDKKFEIFTHKHAIHNHIRISDGKDDQKYWKGMMERIHHPCPAVHSPCGGQHT